MGNSNREMRYMVFSAVTGGFHEIREDSVLLSLKLLAPRQIVQVISRPTLRKGA